MSILYSSYTFDIYTVTQSNDRGSVTESEVLVEGGVRCHFRASTEVVRTSSVAQKEQTLEGKVISAISAEKCTVGDYVYLKEGTKPMGRFIIDTVNENRLASGRVDSTVLEIHRV